MAIEAAHPMSWYRWVGDKGAIIGLERFGASAPFEKIYQEIGITAERVVQAATALLYPRCQVHVRCSGLMGCAVGVRMAT